jgi:uncharacterized protein
MRGIDMKKPIEQQSAYNRLINWIKSNNSVAVAFSGGVDSSLLLAAAHEALGDQVLAVTIDSPVHPDSELSRAKLIAKSIGVRHQIIYINDLDNQSFCANNPNRCYICKKNRFGIIEQFAADKNIQVIMEGSNTDDLSDYRPGYRAIQEHGICSPFIEFGFDKQTIRELARQKQLSVWNLPSASCLASRIPYGSKITMARIFRIATAEELLHSIGFSQVRVRDHQDLARIEVAQDDIERFFDPKLRNQLVASLKEAGYSFVALDLEGYRSGSMNVGL